MQRFLLKKADLCGELNDFTISAEINNMICHLTFFIYKIPSTISKNNFVGM